MTSTKLPEHENCDYSPFDTAALNQIVDAIDGWLVKIEPNIPKASAELDQVIMTMGSQSDFAQAVARLLLTLLNDVKAAKDTRSCLMWEIMNRAYADNEKWDRDNPGFSDPLLRLL